MNTNLALKPQASALAMLSGVPAHDVRVSFSPLVNHYTLGKADSTTIASPAPFRTTTFTFPHAFKKCLVLQKETSYALPTRLCRA